MLENSHNESIRAAGSSRLYRRLLLVVDKMIELLRRHNIHMRRDFTCCNTCGTYEICTDADENYDLDTCTGYLFYHLQVTHSLMEECLEHERKSTPEDSINIDILYTWGLLDGCDDKNLMDQFAHSVQDALAPLGIKVGYTDPSKKLEVKINLSATEKAMAHLSLK